MNFSLKIFLPPSTKIQRQLPSPHVDFEPVKRKALQPKITLASAHLHTELEGNFIIHAKIPGVLPAKHVHVNFAGLDLSDVELALLPRNAIFSVRIAFRLSVIEIGFEELACGARDF